MESQVSLVDAPFGSFRILFGPLKIDLFSVTHPDQALKERRMRQRETKKNCSHTWVLPHDATSGPCPKRRCTVSLSLRGLERRVWVATTKRLLGSLESYENTFTVYYFFFAFEFAGIRTVPLRFYLEHYADTITFKCRTGFINLFLDT